MASQGTEGWEKMDEVLDELSSRFLLLLPESDFESFDRLLFAVESAHWYYEDFFRDKDPSLPKLKLKEFAERMFGHTSLLSEHVANFDDIFAQWRAYKNEVPSCGAAMLSFDMSRVLLVQGMNRGARWGFPKGKVSKDETEMACARREVLEETGFDVGELIRENDYLESMVQGKSVRIYVVRGVPLDFPFETRTRGEIGAIQWHTIDSLPDDGTAPNRGMFYGIIPFTRRLKSWIRRKRKKWATKVPVVSGKQGLAPSSENPASSGRRRAVEYHEKDELTFSGRGGLTPSERQQLFSQYIEDSDKRMKENEDIYRRQREIDDMLLESAQYLSKVKQEKDKRSQLVPTLAFRFNREPILDCFNASDPPEQGI